MLGKAVALERLDSDASHALIPWNVNATSMSLRVPGPDATGGARNLSPLPANGYAVKKGRKVATLATPAEQLRLS